MASVDEAYLDMTGTERLHGRPLTCGASAARGDEVGDATELLHRNRHLAPDRQSLLGQSQAQRRAVDAARQEAKFLAPLAVGDIPGVGKVMEQKLHAIGIQKVGDLASLDDRDLENRFGKWGLALAGKSRGEDAGGWFDNEVGENVDPKSISHEHTFDEDTGDAERLQSTLMRLSEMVGRRLREGGYSRARCS